MTTDYSEVTEVPGAGATREQHERLVHRYGWAASVSEGKRVLEVACGAGFGLGWLADSASQVVAGDYTMNLVRIVRSHYDDRVPALRLDAQRLPFGDGAFDVVTIFEAIYYLPDVAQFIQEVTRVLSPGGTLLIASANREWDGFAESPHSTRYLSAFELVACLRQGGLTDVKCCGVFPVEEGGIVSSVLSGVRQLVVALGLMPKTLKGRELLKRLAYGRLEPLPHELTPSAWDASELVEVGTDGQKADGHKVLYCAGIKG